MNVLAFIISLPFWLFGGLFFILSPWTKMYIHGVQVDGIPALIGKIFVAFFGAVLMGLAYLIAF